MPAQITDEEVATFSQRMRERFFVPLPIDDLLIDIRKTCQLVPEILLPPAQTFIDALVAIHATTSFPYLLANSKANAIIFQRFHITERLSNILKTVGVGVELTDEQVQAAKTLPTDAETLETARASFTSYSESNKGINAIVKDLAVTLLDAIEKNDTANAADELLFQALVSLWSAFEVFARDEFIALLNHHPNVATQILSNENSKKYFELPKLSIDDLSDAGFNLSARLGTLILGTRDFSDIRTIRAAFSAISDDVDSIKVLTNDELWNLNQLRHLIVHRRGVVDAKFKANTKIPAKLGERVTVTPDDIERYFYSIVRSGEALLKGVTAVAIK